MQRRSAGFSLVELMTVVTLVGILAALAMVAWHRETTQVAVDSWAKTVRGAIIAASRRAITTKSPYMLDVKPGSVQYCVVDPATISGPPWATTQTGCGGLGAGLEQGPLSGAPNDVAISYYVASPDVVMPNGTYAAPTKSPISSGTIVFFGANGSTDSTLPGVKARGTISSGFTIYTRRTSIDDVSKRRRIVIYGVSSRSRIVDNY